MAKLAEKSAKVLEYLQANDDGNGVSVPEIASGLGVEPKNIYPIVSIALAAKKDGSRPALVTYEKRTIEGNDKTVGYAVLTAEGRDFVNADED